MEQLEKLRNSLLSKQTRSRKKSANNSQGGFRRFLDAPIKRKLNSLTTLTACVALLVACEVFIITYLVTLRQTMVQELSAQSQVIGTSSIPALASQDPAAGKALLHTLKLQIGINARRAL